MIAYHIHACIYIFIFVGTYIQWNLDDDIWYNIWDYLHYNKHNNNTNNNTTSHNTNSTVNINDNDYNTNATNTNTTNILYTLLHTLLSDDIYDCFKLYIHTNTSDSNNTSNIHVNSVLNAFLLRTHWRMMLIGIYICMCVYVYVFMYVCVYVMYM